MPIGFAPDLTNLLPGNVTSWKVRRSTGGTYNLGPLQDGAKIEAKSLDEQDSVARPRAFGIDIMATAKMMDTHKTNIIPKLPLLNNEFLTQIITFGGGKTFYNQFGFNWKLVSDADLDKSRYVEISADRKVMVSGTLTDWADILGAPPVDVVTDPGDDLYTFLTHGQPIPAGISKFEVKLAADSTYEDLGTVKNGKLTCESLTQKDGEQRSISNGLIRISTEIEMMQTTDEIDMLDNVLATLIDFRLTLRDSAILTLADRLGLQWTIPLPGAVDQHNLIKIMGTGVVTTAQWATIWS